MLFLFLLFVSLVTNDFSNFRVLQNHLEGLLRHYLVGLNPRTIKFGTSKFLGDISTDSSEDYPESLCIKLAKLHQEGTVGGAAWCKAWTADLLVGRWYVLGTCHILNVAGRYLIIPQTLFSSKCALCVPHTSLCGTTAKVHLSTFMKCLLLTFKDLRFLGSHLKAKRPLICNASQLVKRL